MRSPQLLMVSGIGPKEKLQSLGINVLFDRPGVGQNLYVSRYSKNPSLESRSLNQNPSNIR